MRFPSLFNSAPQPTERGYVFSFTFSGIGDPFDPQAIWARPRSMRRDQERLKGLLDDHGYRVGGARHVLSHVVVELPLADVEDDHRICGGESARNLERELAELHGRDLGDKSATPRYRVRGALDLADDEVRVCFGHGIYLPDAGDRMAWKVEVSADGAIWTHLADLPENQRVAIVGRDPGHVSFAYRDWPFADDIHLILDNLPGDERLAISAKPREALKIVDNAELGCRVISAAATDGAAGKLYVRTTRLVPLAKANPRSAQPGQPAQLVAAAAPEPAAKEPARKEPVFSDATGNANEVRKPDSAPTAGPVAQPTAVPASEGTLLPPERRPQASVADETWVCGVVPMHRSALQLAGIAFQRLSRFGNYGIRSLRFGLNARGTVVAPDSRTSILRFELRPDDTMSVATRGGERKLDLNEKLPLPFGGIAEVCPVPPEMADLYAGWLPLAAGPASLLADGQVFEAGRDRSLKTLHDLQVLGATGFLEADRDPGADCMGISSRHARFRLDGQELEVTALGRMPLAILDGDRAFVRTLDKDCSARLSKGQLLVFGHYVLRFS